MKLITRDTDYAIRALCYIAKDQKKITAAKGLAKYTKIPRPFLRKILQALNRGGLLKSYRGKGGGFTLSKPPKGIFITDLITIFQGKVILSEHIFKKAMCPHVKTCALKKKLDEIEKKIVRELEAIDIASLIRK